MKKFNKTVAKQILIASCNMLILFLFCRAQIAFKISPFGVAFAFALVANAVMPVVSCFELFIAMLITNFSVVGAIVAATCTAVLFVYYILQKASGNKKIYLVMLFCFLSGISRIYFAWYSLASVLFALSEVLFSVAICYAFSKVLSALLQRGIQGLTNIDRLMMSLMFFAFGCGVSGFNFVGFDFTKLTLMTLILLLSAFGNHSILYSFMLCAGTFAYFVNFDNLVVYFVSVCLGQVFQLKNRWVYSGLVCLICGLFAYVLKTGIIWFAPVAVANCLYLCVPTKFLEKAKTYVFGANKSVIANFLFEQKSAQTKNKLLTMSIMFQEMQNCYNNSIFLVQNTQKQLNLLASEIQSKMCSNCINRLQCNDNKDMIQDIIFLISRAQDKGRVNLIDVPNLLASNCNKLNSMLANINAAAEELKQKEITFKQEAEERIATGMQMAGTSEIFRELSSQFETNWKFNYKKSGQIKDRLTELGVVCKECVAIEDDLGVRSVIMIIRTSDSVSQSIMLACEKIYHTDFEKTECLASKFSGWNIVVTQPKEHYEIICGVASRAKDEGQKNGDNYVFTKVGKSKYLVAICDGMGHGESANNVSETAIKLVESYYKCGFDDSLVSSSINQMLLPLSSTFSTLDAAIFDSFSGCVNFIKQGSSISVIKKQEQSYIVDVESLPLGADKDHSPTTKLAILSAGDVVVLASDGVVDSFGEERFCEYINNERALNMQYFAESILQEAISREKLHHDDMTVISIKIAQKR